VIELGKPFKDLKEVKTDIRLCDWASASLMLASLIFAALGIIVDVFDMALFLESMSWFLLAIFTLIVALFPYLNYVTAKNLYGIESERKKE
jgi:hypothetical protein